MTRYVIGPDVTIRLAHDQAAIRSGHGCHDQDVADYAVGLRNLLAWRGIIDALAPSRDGSFPRCSTELTAPPMVCSSPATQSVTRWGKVTIGRMADRFGVVRATGAFA